MGVFHITSLRAEPCPVDPRTSRHILEVELHGADGSHRVPTPVVRLMLSSGDAVMGVSTKTGSPADVRKSRCLCGVKTLRSVVGSRRDDDLTLVPAME
jgi:hypothetical protein